MTVKEEFDKFKHDVEEVFHDVEEVFHDVKEHMILSVRDFSIQIAFVLMGITSAILIIGTVYVWCFHHPKRPKKSEDSKDHEHVEEHPSSEQADLPNHNHSVKSSSPKKKTRIPEREVKVEENHQEVFEEVAQKKEDSGISDQNGVRQRTTTANANNNNSPVKSKIPVRQKSRNSSSS
ncbi:uncharacterized protein LOC132725341 [Ruditapes philippinarum]|uniref:uncharacterized protein LOC132725341 n=1 Tax=Ruditapes philippinarum TaxID=129788 RepID=UPI00295BC6D9|nr:uncharacterized protein LOC132725341 [Ruditapes philippinarum]